AERHGGDPPRHRFPEPPLRRRLPAPGPAERDVRLAAPELRRRAHAGPDRGAVPLQDAQEGVRPLQAPPVPYRQNERTRPDARPWYRSISPACDTTRRPPSST